jgi:hypothetical protein
LTVVRSLGTIARDGQRSVSGDGPRAQGPDVRIRSVIVRPDVFAIEDSKNIALQTIIRVVIRAAKHRELLVTFR